jgi:hypothetical protein
VSGGEGVGLLGRSPGIGVLGDNSRPTPAGDLPAAAAKQVGVKGTGFVGVRGEGLTGVWGEGSFSGVFGHAGGRTGNGVHGQSDGALGSGVVGESTRVGIEGRTHGTDGVAVRGVVIGTPTNQSTAVEGLAEDGIGIRGRGRIGVLGQQTRSSGSGLRGEGSIGVVGAATSPNGTAVFAEANQGGTALIASSPNGTAISATSNSTAGFFYGNVSVVGTLRVTGALAVGGSKSAVVRCRDGRRRALYAIEAPESWLEDVGEAQLRHGRAEVRLAKDFAGTIHTAGYQVFLTAYGDVRGLFVKRRTARGFTVAEQQAGTSNARFGYRIVGRRRDLSATRMPIVPLKDAVGPDPRRHLQRLRRMALASKPRKDRKAERARAKRATR